MLVNKVCVTGAGQLSCKYLMHANVPRFRRDFNERGRREAYSNLDKTIAHILDKANSLGDVETIVIPALSAAPRKGFQSFPRKRCAQLVIAGCVNWLDKNGHSTKIKKICLCNDASCTELLKVFREVLHELYKKKTDKEKKQEAS